MRSVQKVTRKFFYGTCLQVFEISFAWFMHFCCGISITGSSPRKLFLKLSAFPFENFILFIILNLCFFNGDFSLENKTSPPSKSGECGGQRIQPYDFSLTKNQQ